MSRTDLARQRLKEIRSLQGFEAAYKLAGLPDDDAKRNTKVKRLSRLINRQTGGFRELDAKQRRRINRSYKTPTRTRALNEARADRYVRQVNKANLEARREARKTFGEGGTNPNPTILQRRLRQYANLSRADRQRILDAYADVEQDGGVALRREYARSLSKINVQQLPRTVRTVEKRRQVKADRAVWRDQGSQTTFEDWMKTSDREKYGE